MADKILVVDDEDKIRAVIRKYGEFEGYEIYEASNGMDAVEMCRENDYDLIIMDVMMPELDGFSACGAIKKIKDIPVIMLSARGEEYDRIHGFEVGVDDYVMKPFSPKELMMRINVVINRNRNSSGNNLETADIFAYEGLEVNFTARTVSIDGVRVVEQEGYTIDFKYDREIEICADEGKMNQVIYNLVNNAINYTGDNKRVNVVQTVHNSRVKIEIIDSGAGIAPKDLPYVWDRYYKVDKAHKRAVMGTGLGLSIVKKVLEMHGATYGVDSNPGQGSNFWLVMNIDCE